ncbi:MAG: hypothetical protein KDJ14_06820 [Xanthomonadales bacterium]|nr:hypothetical protein [Xanthomonadales bacterium]
MNPRAPRLLVTVIVGLVAGLGLHWFFSNFDRVEREVELPPRGAARYNTLFALQHAIEGMGVEVRARPSLDLAAMALSADDLLILASDVRTFGALDVAELADFVADGGRLAFAAPDAEGGDEAPLLDALGVELVAVERCTDWHRLLMGQSSSRCATYALQPVEDGPSRIERRLGDAESGYRLLEGYYGDGQWRALSSLRPIGRRALREPEHRDLATAWILPLLPERGVVHLVFSVDVPPLYVLLVQSGWPLLLPLVLALLFWLWRRAQRLGPVLGVEAPDRRALLEHLRATAEFLFRRRAAKQLHGALHRQFLADLRRDHAEIAALQGDELVRAVAERWALPPEQVRGALYPTELERPARFVAAMRTLTQLRVSP